MHFHNFDSVSIKSMIQSDMADKEINELSMEEYIAFLLTVTSFIIVTLCFSTIVKKSWGVLNNTFQRYKTNLGILHLISYTGVWFSSIAPICDTTQAYTNGISIVFLSIGYSVGLLLKSLLIVPYFVSHNFNKLSDVSNLSLHQHM